MTRRLCLLAVVLGIGLRIVAMELHDHPRGDVVLDVGVTRSLAAGQGFASGFDRGTELVRGDDPLPPPGHADQHAPLWPLLAAPLAALTGAPFTALQVMSLLCGVLLLALTLRLADRLTEDIGQVPDGVGLLAAALVALSFLAIDFSASGALYAAQACGVLLLVDRLGRPRPAPVAVGLILGALLLLNHQCLVLLPLPVVVGVLGASRGERGRAAVGGVLAVAVALLVLVPWWWRNIAVFGDPLHSVNGLYLLHRLGLEPQLSIEQGVPVARFLGDLSAGQLVGALRAQVAPNLLYLFNTGLIVFPMTLGIVAAGCLPGLRLGLATGDRRRLAAWLALLALVAVAVVWPATKLRYVVTMLPLVTALALSRLLRVPGRGERLGLWIGLLAWLGLLALTLDDLGDSPLARPQRWMQMALLGLALYAAPMLLRLRAGAAQARRPRGGVALPLIPSGLPLAVLVTAAVMLTPPHTTYHGNALAPDFFDQQTEVREVAVARALRAAREHLLTLGGGPGGTVIAPVGLLAWDDPELVSLPLGAGTPLGGTALEALLVRHPDVVAVITMAGDGWLDATEAESAPDGSLIGRRWLLGRLEVLAVFPDDVAAAGADAEAGGGHGVILSMVVR